MGAFLAERQTVQATDFQPPCQRRWARDSRWLCKRTIWEKSELHAGEFFWKQSKSRGAEATWYAEGTNTKSKGKTKTKCQNTRPRANGRGSSRRSTRVTRKGRGNMGGILVSWFLGREPPRRKLFWFIVGWPLGARHPRPCPRDFAQRVRSVFTVNCF